MDAAPTDAADQFDSVIVVVLEGLWNSFVERPNKPSSTARLSKQTAIPMSVLRRTLTNLKDAGLADFTIDEEGRGVATLTSEGIDLCRKMSGEAADDIPSAN